MKIAVIQPIIPSYREDFFKILKESLNVDIYVYENHDSIKDQHFNISNIPVKQLKSITVLSKYTLFNPLPILKSRYNLVILIGNLNNLTIPFLLIFLKFIKVKTILWGHGISIHSYLKEEKRLNPLRILFHKLADHIWLYTDAEKNIYQNYFLASKITALNNTINIKKITNRAPSKKNYLLKKYNIKTPINFIFCARFTLLERRADLLKDIILQLDPSKFGFIIIGDGPFKPKFSEQSNVLCFGSLYDDNIKNELFDIADLYLQPAWLGLSVNEAFAYGKGILTFKRSEKIKQCVEYSYLNANNSYIANDIDEMLCFIRKLTPEIITTLQNNALNYALERLTMESMTSKAINSIKTLC
jgi:glycosyltransferase involved in cell wall biosynthesis